MIGVMKIVFIAIAAVSIITIFEKMKNETMLGHLKVFQIIAAQRIHRG